MPELRKDPVTSRWVVLAPDRARRPSDFTVPLDLPDSAGFCPFCPGNESATPPEVFALRASGGHANDASWRVRVVPNRFPALRVEGGLDREAVGPFDRMNGVGAHEVFVDGRDHQRQLSDLEPNEVAELLWAVRERVRDLSRDGRLRHVVFFKNHGRAAGASLFHSHSQLVAMPLVPRHAAEEVQAARAAYARTERCVYCDLLAHERRDRRRVVAQSESAIVLCPWAPRAPFETWLLPTQHAARFEDLTAEVVRDVALLLREQLRRLVVALGDPPYHLVLHTAPLREAVADAFHWRLELAPALSRVGGFEHATGYFINPMPPEEAAEFLRSVDPGTATRRSAG